jgi:hypothetical protein
MGSIVGYVYIFCVRACHYRCVCVFVVEWARYGQRRVVQLKSLATFFPSPLFRSFRITTADSSWDNQMMIHLEMLCALFSFSFSCVPNDFDQTQQRQYNMVATLKQLCCSYTCYTRWSASISFCFSVSFFLPAWCDVHARSWVNSIGHGTVFLLYPHTQRKETISSTT